MGLIQSIVGQQRVQFIQSQTGTIFSIDCTMKETHGRNAEATKFEIEDGDIISDHIILDPFTLELEGIISDSPLSIKNALLTTAAAVVGNKLGGALGAVVGVTGLAIFNALQNSGSPSVAAYAQLLALQENRIPVDIVTKLRTYKDMYMGKLSVPVDNQTGDAMIFNVSFAQLIIVQPQTINIQQFQNGDLSAEEANAGKQELENPLLAKAKQGLKDEQSLAGKFGL